MHASVWQVAQAQHSTVPIATSSYPPATCAEKRFFGNLLITKRFQKNKMNF